MAKNDALVTQIEQMVEDAPEAGFVNYNYGKLSVTANVVSWKDKTPTRKELKRGQQLAKGETLELEFTVGISEFNPKLEFEYVRSVSVRKSSKRLLTDWSEIVEPSLIAVFGKKWAEAVQSGPYVEVQDEPQVSGTVSKKTGKPYSTIKFTRAFKNKAECASAREERYGKNDEASSDASEETFPQETINQVVSLIGSIGKDATLKALADKPFGNYEPDALLDAAIKTMPPE